MPYFCGGRAYFDVVRLSILAVLCPVLLSACGESTPRGYAGSPNSDTLKPVAAPPGADDQPVLAGQTGAPKTPDGLPALTAKGTNTNLFSPDVKNEVDRIDRLENAVQELRNDFDAMAPAIVRLVSIEKDLQNLIGQLDMLTSGTAAPVPPIEESELEASEPVQPAGIPLPPVAPPLTPEDAQASGEPVASQAPVPLTPPTQPPSPAQEAAAPVSGQSAPETASAPPTAITPPVAVAAPAAPPAANGSAVRALRLGEHPGKVRIVLDVSGKTSFNADLDNAEKILVVELPQAAWNAAAQQTFSGNPVLASYKTEPMGDGGTRLIIVLKAGTSIAYKSAMNNPDGSSKIIVDLTK